VRDDDDSEAATDIDGECGECDDEGECDGEPDEEDSSLDSSEVEVAAPPAALPAGVKASANSCGCGIPSLKHRDDSTGVTDSASSTKTVFGVAPDAAVDVPEAVEARTLLSRRRGLWRFLNSRGISSSRGPMVRREDKGNCPPFCGRGGASQRSALG